MPRKITPPLEVVIAQYLADRAGRVGNKIMAEDRSVLFRFSQFHGSQRRLGTVSAQSVADFLQTFVDADRAPGTVNNYRIRLKVFNDWCQRYRYTSQDWMILFEAETVPPRDFVFLSPAQLLSLLPAARNPRDRAMLALGMNTGLRINEILRLTVGDVDLTASRLRIYVSKQRSRRPTITYKPMTSELRNEIVRWLSAYAEEAGPLQPTWYLTPAKDKSKFVGSDLREPGKLRPARQIHNPYLIIRASFESAGIQVPPGEAWHVLRRSAARLYFDSQVESGDQFSHALRRTAALLNHKSTRTTERYLGLSADREALDRDLLDQSFLTRLAADQSAGAVLPIQLRDQSR